MFRSLAMIVSLVALAPSVHAEDAKAVAAALKQGGYVIVFRHGATTVDKGGTVLPHTHPGVEMSYLLEGRGTLKIAGQPDRTVSAGDSVSIPAVAVHGLVNTGPGAIVMVTTYVVEKDKPLATPVP